MDLKTTAELIYRFGFPVAGCVLLGWVMYKVGMKILDSYERRETVFSKIINEGMKTISDQVSQMNAANVGAHQMQVAMLQQMEKNQKDGFDRMVDTAKYQREEHKEMIKMILDGQKSAETAREAIMDMVKEASCKLTRQELK